VEPASSLSGVDVFANGVGFGTQGCFVVKEINRKSFFVADDGV
jgi:hypothetical protein